MSRNPKTPAERMGNYIKKFIFTSNKPNTSEAATGTPFLNQVRVGKGTGCGTSVSTVQPRLTVAIVPPSSPGAVAFTPGRQVSPVILIIKKHIILFSSLL